MRSILVVFGMLPLSFGVAPAQSPIAGVWNFDETGGLVASDAGPLANNGTLVNFTNDPAQWIAGVSGNALSFDGVDDYVELPTGAGLPFFHGLGETFSVCMWVRGSPTNDDRILSLGNANLDSPLFTLGTGRTSLSNEGKLQVYARNDDNTSSARYSNATVFDNTWHHIAYVETSGQGRLWVDGVLDTASFDDRFGARGSRTAGYGTYSLDKVALGGVLRPSVCCHFQGAIDSLRIFRFELNEADVQTVMNGGLPGTCRASIGEFGVGCGPGPLDLYAAGSPILGGSGLVFSMRGGRPNASALLCLGVGPMAPIDLGPFGAPGCTLYQPSATCVPVGNLTAFGSSLAIPIGVPNIPAIACVTIGFQGVGLAPGAADFSNAVVTVLGY